MERVYLRPTSLEEAVAQRATTGTAVLAGGTDILVQWREKSDLHKPVRILDLGGIDVLREIREEQGEIVIGSMVTHRNLAQSPLILRVAPVLGEAAFSVGSPQIRNRGTIGGTLGNASPAADLSPVLVALDARVELISQSGMRELPVAVFLEGMNQTALKEDEIINAIRFRMPEPSLQSAFVKVGRRNAVAIARLNGACFLQKDNAGNLEQVVVVIGSATPTPLNMTAEAQSLLGDPLSEDALHGLARQTVKRVEEIAGVRASAKWKFPAVENLVLKLFRAVEEGGVANE